jgi:Zn-dependent M28 family amino/carboxypeptidase
VKWIAAVAVVAACGTSPRHPTTPDGGGDVDAGIDAPPGCTRPPLDAAFLRPLLQTTLQGLPAPRATASERDAARDFLMAQLGQLGFTPELQQYPNGANVIATIPATSGSARSIVVGAHFDTVSGSPGANDNGSGTAAVLAVARFLADMPCRDAPVTVAFFDQEEIGLFGSREMAKTLAPADVRAVHTIDQVSFDGDGDRVFELELPTAALEAEWRAAATIVGVTVKKTSTSGTDHQAFRDRGFAAMGLTEEFVGGDTSPHRHQPSDTVATVDFDYLELAARLAAQVVMSETGP